MASSVLLGRVEGDLDLARHSAITRTALEALTEDPSRTQKICVRVIDVVQDSILKFSKVWD
jgi:hypothetical protein